MALTNMTPATNDSRRDETWHGRRVSHKNDYHTLARVHIQDDARFVHDVILDRNEREYPDPCLRDVFTPSILRRYWGRICEATTSYTPNNEAEAEQIAEFREEERERVHEQLGFINYPNPDEYGFDGEFMRELDGGVDGKPEVINRLYRMPLKHLRYLSGWYAVNGYKTSPKPFNSIRYVRGDPTVDFQNTTDLVDAEDETINKPVILVNGKVVDMNSGLDVDFIRAKFDKFLQECITKYDPLLVAFGLVKMDKVTNFNSPETDGGRATSRGEINIQTLTVSWDEGTSWNTIAHEFFHHIQYSLKLSDQSASGHEEWELTEPDVEVEECEWEPLSEVQQQMVSLWEDFCAEKPSNILREYQQKNMNEFYALAFEAYFEEPEVVRKTQPRVYNLIERLVNP